MPEQRYAVLIGNRTYLASENARLPNLRCPANDVAGLGDLLESTAHGPYVVRRLVDAPHNAAIDGIYDVLMNKAGTDDLVLVYYSGHGKPDANGDLYLAASNTKMDLLPTTSIPLETIGRWMNRARVRKTILILDCCFSGAVDKIFTRGQVSEQVTQAIPKDLSGSGSYILTASSDIQLAEEKEGDQYGLLTKHILQGIRSGDADRDDDGFVSMLDLLSYVQERVAEEGAQTPQGYALRMEGGQLAIARSGKPARSQRSSQVVQAIHAFAATHPLPKAVVSSALEVAYAASGAEFAQLYEARLDPDALVAVMWEISSPLPATSARTRPQTISSPVASPPSTEPDPRNGDVLPEPNVVWPKDATKNDQLASFSARNILSRRRLLVSGLVLAAGLVLAVWWIKFERSSDVPTPTAAVTSSGTGNSSPKTPDQTSPAPAQSSGTQTIPASVAATTPAKQSPSLTPRKPAGESQPPAVAKKRLEAGLDQSKPQSSETMYLWGPKLVPLFPSRGTLLSSVDFSDKKRPSRVSGSAMATLDDVATRLKQDPNALIIVAGCANPSENIAPGVVKSLSELAQQRAENVKNYLVQQQGIDSARVQPDVCNQAKVANIRWVPPGQ